MRWLQFLSLLFLCYYWPKDSAACEIDDDLCKCQFVEESRACTCPAGFRLAADKLHCLDIDECLLNNGHGSCQDACNNTFGGYVCSCTIDGTKLSHDNHTCEDIDECKNENFFCSHICINTFGSAFCACPDGFILDEDWKTCVDINECESEEITLNCKGICVNTPGSHLCKENDNDIEELIGATTVEVSCPDGFSVNAHGHCIAENPCLHNGGCAQTCDFYNEEVICSCGEGFYTDSQNKSNCLEKTCPPIIPKPSLEVECMDYRRQDNIYPAGSLCKMKCKRGFRLKGVKLLVCGENGHWSSPTPVCKPTKCIALNAIHNGNILPSSCVTGTVRWNQHCYYSCHPGYTLIGKAIATCQKNSKWSSKLSPTCHKNVQRGSCQGSLYDVWLCYSKYKRKY